MGTQKRRNDPQVDVLRDFDIAKNLKLQPQEKIQIVRYNPDSFCVDGVTRRVPAKERQARLLAFLQEAAGPLAALRAPVLLLRLGDRLEPAAGLGLLERPRSQSGLPSRHLSSRVRRAAPREGGRAPPQ